MKQLLTICIVIAIVATTIIELVSALIGAEVVFMIAVSIIAIMSIVVVPYKQVSRRKV